VVPEPDSVAKGEERYQPLNRKRHQHGHAITPKLKTVEKSHDDPRPSAKWAGSSGPNQVLGK